MQINSNLHFQNSQMIVKYNINSLIDKKELPSTVVSGLNLKLVERLKTIEFKKDSESNSNSELKNISNITKASFDNFQDMSNFAVTPYHEKYLLITETIILEKIKNEKIKNINLKERYDLAIKNETLKGNPYIPNQLIRELLKEFTITFNEFVKNENENNSNNKNEHEHDNENEHEYENEHEHDNEHEKNDNEHENEHENNLITSAMYKELLIGSELDNNPLATYIGRALSTIHTSFIKELYIKKQILNPHIDITRFEKEVKISQTIHINTNSNTILIQIKNSLIIHKEDFKNITLEKQKKELLTNANRIFTTVVELLTIECIPTNFKLYCI